MEVYGRLLETGMDVYVPLMYIRHDCVVITPDKRHVDIEIKSRAVGESGFVVGNFKPRPDLFFILHYEGTSDSWVLPSEIAKDHLSGSGDRIILGDRMKEELHLYHDGYHFILRRPGEFRRGTKQPPGRIAGKHFKQSDYEREALRILSQAQGPMRTQEIVQMVKDSMGSSFSEKDLEEISQGRLRWESTTRFAIYQGLKPEGLIEAKTKNQWTITQKGKDWLSKL